MIKHIQDGATFIHYLGFQQCSDSYEESKKLSSLYLQVGKSFSRNVDLRSAVHRAFAYRSSPKITTYMATFLGHPVRPIWWLVVSFYGAI
jgi:hypothetical protein